MKKVMICFLVLILVGFGSATDHYVRSNASGANNGSDWTNAYTSLPSTLVRGDTYYIANGNYGGYVFDDALDGTKYIYIKKATIDGHGTGVGWLNSYGDGQAVFSEETATENTAIIKFTQWNYIFDGMISGGKNPSNYGFLIKPVNCFRRNYLIGVPGMGNDIRIENVKISNIALTLCGIIENVGTCYPTGNSYYDSKVCTYHHDCFYCKNNPTKQCMNEEDCLDAEGDCVGYTDLVDTSCVGSYDYSQIHIYSNALNNGAKNITISHNYLSGGSSPILTNNWENGVIENNYFDGQWTSALWHGQIIDPKRSDNVILRNNIFKNGRAFLIGAHQKDNFGNSNWQIYNNIVIGGDYTGVWGSASSSYIDIVRNWQVHHNTHVNVDCGSGGVRPCGISSPEYASYAYNNLFYNSRNCNMLNPGYTAVDAVISDNNVYLKCTGTACDGANSYKNDSAENPFVDINKEDFSIIGVYSSILDIGANLDIFYDIDYFGNLRDDSPTVGAFEYISGIPIPPLDFHKADLDKDYKINLSEVGFFIGVWRERVVSLGEVIVAIRIWSNGECYNEEACGASATTFVQSFENEEVVVEEPEIVEGIPVVENSGDEVLWLKFDGDLSDSSGNSVGVSCVDCPIFVDGKYGSAYHFDGVDDRIIVNSLSALTTKTISFWAKFDEHKSYNMIYEDSVGDYAGFNREKAFRINWLDNSGEEVGYIHDFGGDIGSWNFYVIVYDVVGDNLEIRFYRDGKLLDEKASGSRGLIGNSITGIGARNSGTGSFSGTIDDFRIWDRALSEEEVAQLS